VPERIRQRSRRDVSRAGGSFGARYSRGIGSNVNSTAVYPLLRVLVQARQQRLVPRWMPS